ncbi:hypothetical protein [Hymenobacter cheonanensis]|uniref:hypothetical protein n=1 Tax=Hymenobacter sp. CA2-7 TaxID=3063993 RepID=UPI002713DC91|nr:hypothetical protein [Hymenobacter sp. CA2-7]MDO7885506.1 hypothetical protein [Hymenobacter sp. CA2-7]
MKLLILGIIFLLISSSSDSRAQGQSVRLVRVEREYLRDLDDGKECVPIEIGRKKGEQLDLVLPPLYRNSVSIWDEENWRKFFKRDNPYQPIQRTGSGENDERKEIVLHLSKLKDGTYYVWLVGDSVGGTFQIHLKTE